jgi:cytochrome c oxidase assembly protein Cox11
MVLHQARLLSPDLHVVSTFTGIRTPSNALMSIMLSSRISEHCHRYKLTSKRVEPHRLLRASFMVNITLTSLQDFFKPFGSLNITNFGKNGKKMFSFRNISISYLMAESIKSFAPNSVFEFFE